MGRHVVTTATSTLAKGQVVELTAAQEAALAASLRTTAHRDTTGEPVGVSN